MEKEIELLNETEAALLRLMAQYQSGQYVTLGECVSNVRAVRETFRHLTQRAADECPTCAGLGFVNDDRGRRGVDCSDCNGSGIRR